MLLDEVLPPRLQVLTITYVTMKSLIEENGTGRTPAIRHRPDELTKNPDPDGAADRLAQGTLGKRRGWPKGKTRIRKTKLAVLGIPSGVLAVGNQDYARCVRLASAYRKARVRELMISHGFVSSGASALLASASLAIASSRYLYEQAAAAGEGMLEILKTAARLADSARQNELAAWELCARESVAKRKAITAEQGLPWVLPVEEQRKPGPKKKDHDLPAIGLPPYGSALTVWVEEAKIPLEEGDESGGRGKTERGDGQDTGG